MRTDEGETQMSLPGRTFFFRGKECRTPEELANAFLEGDEAWNDALFVVDRGFVQKWLEYNGDFGRAAEMEKNAEKSAGEQSAQFAAHFAVPVTPEAQFRFGRMFLEGVIAPQDSVKAAEWLSRAAEQGYPHAQSCLDAAASALPVAQPEEPLARIDPDETKNGAPEPGDAETPDTAPGAPASPESRLEEAENGNADEQFNLGRMYATGRGAPRDDNLAIEWYRKAVKRGHPNALYNLGRMYEEGRAVRQNFVKAYRLYFRASLHGIREADDAMIELKKKSWLRRPKVSEAEAARIEQEEGYRPWED